MSENIHPDDRLVTYPDDGVVVSPFKIRDSVDVDEETWLTSDIMAAIGLCAHCQIRHIPPRNDRHCSSLCFQAARDEGIPAADELADLYEELGSIAKLASHLGRDKNVIRRRLIAIGLHDPDTPVGNPSSLERAVRRDPQAWIDRLGLGPVPDAEPGGAD